MRSRSATTFGRDAELRQILAVADKARAGEPVSVLVHGEAGVGKTRLVSDLVAALREQDELVFAGHGVPLSEGEVPFGVLTESLRDLVRTIGVHRVRESIGTDAEQLASLVPALRSGARAEPDRARIISATADLLSSIATDRLVCWVVEDLQWTDVATVDAFTYLTRFLTSSRVLMVATWRDVDDGPDRPALTVESIGLHPLRGEELEDLVAAIVPGLDTPERQRIVELSEGLPFLVEELADSWQPGVGVDPAFLRRLVLTRLPGLTRSARELLELAAVGEGHLDGALLEDGLGVDPAAIREAVDAGILESGGRRTLRFRHALLREAITGAIPPGDLLRLHHRWAEAIESDDRSLARSARTFALATHWHEAQVPEKALPALAEAARTAQQLPAPSVTHVALTRIMRSWELVPDPAALTGMTRERMLVDAVKSGMTISAFESVVELLRSERARPPLEEDPVGAGWVDVRLYLFDDNYRTTIPPRAAVEAVLGGRLDDPRVLDALVLFAGLDLPDDLVSRMVGLLERVRDESNEASERLAAAQALSTLRVRAGQLDEAVAGLPDLRAQLSGASLEERWALAGHEAWLLVVLGRPAGAIVVLEEELGRLSRPSILAQTYQFLAENLAGALVAVGRWDTALELAADALVATPELGAEEEVLLLTDWLRMHIATVHAARGALDDARRFSAIVAEHAGASPWADRSPHAWVIAALATISAAEGDLMRCREELAGAWEPRVRMSARDELAFAVLAALRAESALVNHHDPRALAESAAVVEPVLATAERLPRPGPRGGAWWAEAHAHAARSRGGDTAADWAPAVAGWRECGQPYDVATCLRYLGEASLGDGDASAATEALVEAYGICQELGARPLADTVLAVARRGRLPVGPTAGRSGPGSLTVREVEVLGLVAEGLSNQQIAAVLFMSPKTVSVHVSRILTKLGAANRTEAAATGRRLGLVG